jgi:predicted protein tyrosine phosphatase
VSIVEQISAWTRERPRRAVASASRLHVCSLAAMPDIVRHTGARRLITLINGQMIPDTPDGVHTNDHLRIACNDIVEPREGLVCPHDGHVGDLIAFARAWDHEGPLVIHCWAGISRSTAGAFIALCALNPDACEAEIAALLREASPTASPNRRLVTLADAALDRSGRMIEAVERIGAGEPKMAATPFSLASRIG